MNLWLRDLELTLWLRRGSLNLASAVNWGWGGALGMDRGTEAALRCWKTAMAEGTHGRGSGSLWMYLVILGGQSCPRNVCEAPLATARSVACPNSPDLSCLPFSLGISVRGSGLPMEALGVPVTWPVPSSSSRDSQATEVPRQSVPSGLCSHTSGDGELTTSQWLRKPPGGSWLKFPESRDLPSRLLSCRRSGPAGMGQGKAARQSTWGQRGCGSLLVLACMSGLRCRHQVGRT